MITTVQIAPKPEKVGQLHQSLCGRFGRHIYKYTVSPDGVFTLYGTMNGTVRDVVRTLEAEGFAA